MNSQFTQTYTHAHTCINDQKIQANTFNYQMNKKV